MLVDLTVKEFKDAHSEDSVYQIRNIFYYAKAKNLRIRFIYSGLIYHGSVKSIGRDHITFDIPEFKESQERKVLVIFESLNRYYLTRVFIHRINEKGLFTDVPVNMRYLARRIYPRISLDDMFIRFIVLHPPIFAAKEAEKNTESRYPNLLAEILLDNPSLKSIHRMLVHELDKINHDYEIEMLYNQDREYNILEQTLESTGKSVLISDVAQMNSYTEPIESESVVSLYDYFQEKTKELGCYDALLHMEEIKKIDTRSFLVSILLIPIHLFDKLIGYIKIETNQFDKHFITLSQAEEISSVAGLFSYAITKIRIRNSHFDLNVRRIRVLNVSLSGLLMEITDEALFNYLQKYRRAKILMPLENHELEIYGEIIRYFARDGAYYMGVLFFKSQPDDMKKLEEYIYNSTIKEKELLVESAY